MSNAGKKVKVHYIGTLDDGTQFDSSLDRGEPLEFICMAGQMIAGFDAAVVNMVPGETNNVHIPAAEAYGERDEDMVQDVPIGQIPGLEEIPVGESVSLRGPGAASMMATIVAVDDQTISLDLNHRLAGCDLNFEITLVEVIDQ